MASPRTPIIIDEGDDIGSSLHFQRPRSESVNSTASSHTMRADSSEPEVEVVSKVNRLSIRPSSPVEASRTEIRMNECISNARKRNDPREEEEEYAHLPRHRPFRFHRQRNEVSSQHGPMFRKVNDLEEEKEQVDAFGCNMDEFRLIDVDALELKLEDEIFRERLPARGKEPISPVGPRNAPVVLPFVKLDIYKWKDVSLKAEKTVELSDGCFLMISAIIQNLQTDEIALRGWKLKRARQMDGIVPMKINEVTFIYEVDLDDRRLYRDQSVVEVKLEDVFRVRKLIRTNLPFPQCRFDPDDFKADTKKEVITRVESSGVLVARWKLTTIFDTESDRLHNPNKPNNYRRRQLESLSEEECSSDYVMEVSYRREFSRGETTLGGSGTKRIKVKPESRAGYASKPGKRAIFISLLGDEENNSDKKSRIPPRQLAKPTPKLEQVYTYGDTFSGGGGSLRGASMAGLKLKYGLDFNSLGCATLRANFPDIEVFEMWANEFTSLPDLLNKLYVDILHLSPPCQVWSPIHTRPGRDDEMNFASLFAVQLLIDKTKPRMVTLEQTFGILFYKFVPAFNSLIRMFTDNGYSTAWQVVEFHKYGLPQRRKRLIIIAAGPGETLSELPAYTHSEHGSGSFKKYVSVREILNAIPRNASQHDIAAAHGRAKYQAWDDSSITKCITTNGGENNCHPSGQRGLTPREFAALQGFPHEHFFIGRGVGVIKKQIGNAVPPLVAKILFESVRKHLESADAAEQRANNQRRQIDEELR